MLVGDARGAGAGRRIEGAYLITETPRGDGGHAAELAAAEDADGAAGLQGTLHGSALLALAAGNRIIEHRLGLRGAIFVELLG